MRHPTSEFMPPKGNLVCPTTVSTLLEYSGLSLPLDSSLPPYLAQHENASSGVCEERLNRVHSHVGVKRDGVRAELLRTKRTSWDETTVDCLIA